MCIRDRHQGADGVEHRGNKISFYRERALGALAQANNILLHLAGGIEFQAGDDLAGKNLKDIQSAAAEGIGLNRADGDRSQNHARGR